MPTQRLACSVAAVLAATLVSWGCIVPSGEDGEPQLDLAALHQHVEAAELSILDLAIVFADTDPDLSAKLTAAHGALEEIDRQLEAALAGDGPPTDASAAIDLFLQVTADLVNVVTDDPEEQARLRLGIVAARAILVQVKLALAQ